jgi:hypothetical protein
MIDRNACQNKSRLEGALLFRKGVFFHPVPFSRDRDRYAAFIQVRKIRHFFRGGNAASDRPGPLSLSGEAVRTDGPKRMKTRGFD